MSGAAGAAEGALHALSYVLPGRFADSELIAEWLRACLRLLRIAGASRAPPGDIAAARLCAYSSFLARHNKTTGILLTLLDVCRAAQVPAEMVAARILRLPARLRAIALLEIAKAAARFYVFWASSWRPVLRTFVPEIAHAASDEDVVARIEASTDKAAETAAVLRESAVDAHVLVPELCVLPAPGALQRAREVARIARPAVYAALLAASGASTRHSRAASLRWAAWLASLSLDVFAEWPAISTAMSGLIPGLPERVSQEAQASAIPVSPVEAEERVSRFCALALHVLRAPVYETAARPCIDGLADALDGLAITRPLAATLRSYQRLVADYVLYTLD